MHKRDFISAETAKHGQTSVISYTADGAVDEVQYVVYFSKSRNKLGKNDLSKSISS